MVPRSQVPRQQRASRLFRGRAVHVRPESGTRVSILPSLQRDISTTVINSCACTSDDASALLKAEPVSCIKLPLSDNGTERAFWSTLAQNVTYCPDDMIEIGYVWKHLGIRGEVAIRTRTSFEDMRLGLAGTRYLMPCDSHALSLPGDPLEGRPPLFQLHQRLARQKVQSEKTVWLALFVGCCDRDAAEQLRYARVFMHRDDCPQFSVPSDIAHGIEDSATPGSSADAGDQQPPPAPPGPPASTVPPEALRRMSAEEIRGFAALLTAPAAMACGGVRVGDGAAEALLRPGGAVCVGRVMDVLHDEGRFYDTSEYVRARGMVDLPGACPVFRVAFHRGLVAAPDGGLADVDSLLTEELLQAEGAQELREHGVLSNGATPLWMPNARSGLLPLLPEHVLHIDYVAETVEFTAPERWLRDHLAPRMIKRRPPRRSEKVKQTMGNKYRKRRDKAFIRRKGKFARLGRNMRKT